MRKLIAFLLVLLVLVAGAMESAPGKAHEIVKFAGKTKDHQGVLEYAVVDENHEVKLRDTYIIPETNITAFKEMFKIIGSLLIAAFVDDGAGYTVGQFNPEPLSGPEATESVIIGFKICTVPVALASLTKIDNRDEVGDADEGLFEVSFGYVDPFECQPVTCKAELVCEGGKRVAVEKGQIVEIEIKDEKCEIEYEDGRLQIQGQVKLIVTCSNETGSSAAEALPEGLSADNDLQRQDAN